MSKRIKLSELQFKQLVEINMDDLIGTEAIDKPIYGMNSLNTEQESIDVEPDVEGYVSLEETELLPDEITAEGANLEGPSKYGYGNDAPFKDSPNFNVGESVTADTLGDVIKYAIRETLNEVEENPCDSQSLNPTQYEECLGHCCATMGGICCDEKTTGIGKGMTSDSKSIMDEDGALKRTELIKKKMALRDKQVQRKKMSENSHHLVHRTHEAEEYSMNKTKGGDDPCACSKTSDCKDAISSGCKGNKCRDSKCVADGMKTSDNPIRRHDREMAKRRPYSSRHRDMRGSRDMGKMNENRRNIDEFLDEKRNVIGRKNGEIKSKEKLGGGNIVVIWPSKKEQQEKSGRLDQMGLELPDGWEPGMVCSLCCCPWGLYLNGCPGEVRDEFLEF